jgi:hypothetical protein
MKAVLFAVGVLGLGALFAMSEPETASATPVSSDDVVLVSEEMSEQSPGLTCIYRNPKGKGKASVRGY